MTSLQTYFNRSQSLEQYIEQMKDNKENLLSIYKSLAPYKWWAYKAITTNKLFQGISHHWRLVWRCNDESPNIKTNQWSIKPWS